MSAITRHKLEQSPPDLLWEKLEQAMEWAKRWEGTPEGATWASRVYTFRIILRRLGEIS